MMVGRAVELTVDKEPAKPGDDGLRRRPTSSVIDARDQYVVDDVIFDGARGRDPRHRRRAGQRPDRAHRGDPRPAGPGRAARSPSTGSSCSASRVRRVLDAGVGFVPEDRKEDGLVAEFTIAENLMLDRSDGAPFVQGAARCSSTTSTTFAEEKLARVRHPRAGHRRPTSGRLSGGNQQKVVLARELSRDLRLFVAAQPTRGLDVGSIEFVHKRIVAARDAGIPVIVVSTELDEVVALADRIAVMYRGRHRRHRARRHPARRARPHDGRRDARGGGGVSDEQIPAQGQQPETTRRAGPGARRAEGPGGRRRRGGAAARRQPRPARDRHRQRAHLGARGRARPGRRRDPDRGHRPRRAGRGRLLLRAARRHLPGDLGRRSAGAYVALFQGVDLQLRSATASSTGSSRSPRRSPSRRR